MQSDTEIICHYILLTACVGAITALSFIDIRNGGDGGALAAGLAAIAAVGGFQLKSLLPISTE